MATRTSKRERTLYGLSAKQPHVHRYTKIRWTIAVLSTIGVALLPLTDTLRFDLWSGRHAWRGERVDLVRAAKAFLFPFLALNVGIVIVSRFFGRWLCGFGCPIGNLNRLAEWLHWRGRTRLRRWLGHGVMFGACGLLAAITFSFWIDWRVFTSGTALAASIASALLLVLTLGLWGLTAGMGMRFCRDYCPSGVYFAVLGPSTLTGVEFAHPQACTDCHACTNVCPTELEPRRMADAPTRDGRGFYPDGLSNFANCLRCGDCVEVCEATTSGQELTPLRMGRLPASAAVDLEVRP